MKSDEPGVKRHMQNITGLVRSDWTSSCRQWRACVGFTSGGHEQIWTFDTSSGCTR